MALESHPPLGPGGLTPTERLRQTICGILGKRFPNLPEEDIWSHTLAVSEAVAGWVLPQSPASLVYAWSDGTLYSTVDRPGGIPDDTRERALLRALLTHALQQLEQAEIEGPLRPLRSSVVAP